MITTQLKVRVRDVYDGYKDMDWDGVVGFGGKLDIRPAFQREYIYDIPDAQKVIETVLKDHPLNIMYWVKTPAQTFELLDGQQRTLSICKFLDSKYYIIDENNNKQYAHSIGDEKLNRILNYELLIWVCEGGSDEVLDWFKTINIKGKELNEQEALNAVYTGAWLTDAKRHFSKPNCPAYGLGKDYLNGEITRQDFLATTLRWISDVDVKKYMAEHRMDSDADELWSYFENVISWVKKTFITYFREMDGLNWGKFYNDYRNKDLDAKTIDIQVKEMMSDIEIQKKSGIFEYVLTGNGNVLNLRTFDDSVKRAKYEQQKQLCAICGKRFTYEEMEGDHIIAWSKGGRTEPENCRMLCKEDNLAKGNRW